MTNQMLSVTVNSLRPTAPTEALIDDFKTSARTSIARRAPSAPLKQLLAAGLINGSVLNYGKGRTNKDQMQSTRWLFATIMIMCTPHTQSY